MNIMDIMGGGLTADKIPEILGDSAKVKELLPIFVGLADTFKEKGEHGVSALISFEEGQPILRVVTTKIIEIDGAKKFVINRNVKNGESDLVFNLLDLLTSHNEEKPQ